MSFCMPEKSSKYLLINFKKKENKNEIKCRPPK